MKLIHLQDVPVTMAHDDLARKRFIGPEDLESGIQTVNYVELHQGQSFVPHAHPDCEECFFVIEGTAEAVINGKILQLAKGDLLVVQPNEEHTFKNLSKSVFTYFQFRVLLSK